MSETQATFGAMISSGVNNFKVAFENFKPRIGTCLTLWVPFVVISGVLSLLVVGGTTAIGFGAANQAGSEEGAAASIIGGIMLGFALLTLILSPFAAYVGFCFVRFTSRAGANPGQTFSFGSLYAYESSLWGFLGLLVLLTIAGFVAAAVGMALSVVLFFLVGLPYVAALSAFNCFLWCSMFSYFESTQAGVFAAMSRGWSLVTKDWKRWAAMTLLMVGAFVALFFGQLLLSVTIGLIPVIGALIVMTVTILVSCYLAFAINACYRDSAAAVK